MGLPAQAAVPGRAENARKVSDLPPARLTMRQMGKPVPRQGSLSWHVFHCVVRWWLEEQRVRIAEVNVDELPDILTGLWAL